MGCKLIIIYGCCKECKVVDSIHTHTTHIHIYIKKRTRTHFLSLFLFHTHTHTLEKSIFKSIHTYMFTIYVWESLIITATLGEKTQVRIQYPTEKNQVLKCLDTHCTDNIFFVNLAERRLKFELIFAKIGPLFYCYHSANMH